MSPTLVLKIAAHFVLGNKGSSDDRAIDWAALVPEPLVGGIKKSLWFWRDICRFAVLFDRPDEGFTYRDLGGAQIMPGEIVKTRDWVNRVTRNSVWSRREFPGQGARDRVGPGSARSG